MIKRWIHVGLFATLSAAVGAGCGDTDESGIGGRTESLPPSDIEELTFENFTVEALDSLGSGYLPALAAKGMKANPWTREKAELGRYLFFDKRLSKDETVACATCHNPSLGWTDQRAFSKGIRGQKGDRSAPTVINRVFGTLQFWDGRAASLAAQAGSSMQAAVEMGETHENIVRKISAIAGYTPLFNAAFGDENVDIDRITKAIASFERTIISYDSAYDRSQRNPDKWPLSESAERGRRLFFDTNAGRCSACHSGPNFTDEDFHNIGVGMTTADGNDPNKHRGRGEITGKREDLGRFRTPTLRNITDTAPYMHDGSLKTLEDVVRFYVKGGAEKPLHALDEKMKALPLDEQAQADIVAFLKSLTGWVTTVTEPKPLE